MNSLTLVSESDDDAPAGMALISGEGLNGGRVYLCDPANHVIDVLDDSARPLFSFGGLGSGPGQFNMPVDLALVPVSGDRRLTSVNEAVLVIADRGNHRLQLFTLDGVWLATVDSAAPGPPAGWTVRTGWPFFHLGLHPCVRFPSSLRWRAPFLDVSSGVGGVRRLDLPVALLPDFDTWLRTASRPTLREAYRAFAGGASGRRVPDSCLRRIARRLYRSSRATVVSKVRR
jgi:hypothetical protein